MKSSSNTIDNRWTIHYEQLCLFKQKANYKNYCYGQEKYKSITEAET